MFKSLLAVAAVGSVATPAAFAGPYINTEVQNGYVGSDYIGRTIDIHLGYEGSTEKLDYYIQGGPALINGDAVEGSTEFSGKTGVNIAATERLDVYGEVSLLTAEDTDNSYATKIGGKFKF